MNAQIQVDVNGLYESTVEVSLNTLFPVPVSSVSIAPDLSVQEGIEMILTCTAIGGRPAPTFTWIMPDTVQFQVEESSALLVSVNK